MCNAGGTTDTNTQHSPPEKNNLTSLTHKEEEEEDGFGGHHHVSGVALRRPHLHSHRVLLRHHLRVLLPFRTMHRGMRRHMRPSHERFLPLLPHNRTEKLG